MGWVQLTLEVRATDSEVVQSWLDDFGAGGVEVRDGLVPMPKTRQPAPGNELLIAYFEQRKAALEALEHSRALTVSKPELSGVPNKDWSTAWRKRVKAVTAGRLWVGPPWKKAPKKKVAIIIEPRMAFGTGDHPTTWLCLGAVDAYCKAHPKASVLDVGTGTGVLALAAKKLGAGKVIGTDNDPIAVEQSLENARDNKIRGVDFKLATLQGLTGRYDLVVANILAHTLIDLAKPLAAKTGHRLVLSGVLATQREDVERAYLKQGLCSLGFAQKKEWVRLDFERKK
ncbi:MAG: 50S ribosomal protein L11 methyltransferase [Myxococcaceae bacterium]